MIVAGKIGIDRLTNNELYYVKKTSSQSATVLEVYMKTLQKLFPLSFKAKDGLVGLLVNVLIQLIVGVVAGVLIGVLVAVPVVGIIAAIVCGLLDVYVVIGIILSILDFLKVI